MTPKFQSIGGGRWRFEICCWSWYHAICLLRYLLVWSLWL